MTASTFTFRTLRRSIFPVLVFTHLICRFAYTDNFQNIDQAELTDQMVEQAIYEAEQIQNSLFDEPIAVWTGKRNN